MAEENLLADMDSALRKVREFRGMLEAELRGESTKANYRRIETRLEDLALRSGEAAQPEILEARILNNILYKQRPAVTLQFLRRLRIKREEAFGMGAYTSFAERVSSILAPLVVTKHGYKMPFDQQNHALIWATLGERIDALIQNYPVFLNSGTLLGVVRDGGLIGHDDDIDLGVVLNAKNTTDAAQEWLELYHYLVKLGLTKAEQNQQSGLKIIKLEPIDDIEIDLFPCWIEDGGVQVFPHTRGELAKDDLLPLQPSAVKGFYIPAQPERMLAVNYGADWRTPDPFFIFDWSRARRRFAEFDNALDQAVEDAENAKNTRVAAQ